MEIDVLDTLGLSIPVSQQDGSHLHDVHCVLLLQRDADANLPFSHEDRDLAGLVVAHLCASIASVWNTTDLLLREHALADLLSSNNTDKILTLKLNENGYLVEHDCLTFQKGHVGFVSKTLLLNSDLKRIHLNLSPTGSFQFIEQLMECPYDDWLCDSVKVVIKRVLEAVEEGKPTKDSWIAQEIALPAGPTQDKRGSVNTRNRNSMRPVAGAAQRYHEKGGGDGDGSSSTDQLNSDKALRLQVLNDFTSAYSHFDDDGESRLLGLFSVCDTERNGLLPIGRFLAVLKNAIHTELSLEKAENLLQSMDSLVQGHSHTDQRVHYVKFVRSLVPPIACLRKAHLVVIPSFAPTSTSHQVCGVRLQFSFSTLRTQLEHFD
jgi:hypothetical protein